MSDLLQRSAARAAKYREENTGDPYWDQVVLAIDSNYKDSDIYSNQVVLNLSMDGDNNGSVFTDTKGKVISRVGNVETRTSIKAIGTASAYFPGNGEHYLTTPTTSDFDFGLGEFTVEMFFNITGNGNPSSPGTRDATLVHTNANPIIPTNDFWGIGIMGSTTTTGTGIFVQAYGPVDDHYALATVALNQNQFYHLAVTRDSNKVLRVFIDGVSITLGTNLITNTTPFSPSTSNSTFIGCAPYRPNYNNIFQGYIDNLRITKGVARYTSNFTSPLKDITDKKGHAITVLGNTVISSSQKKFGTGSLYFDGSGDYIQVPSSVDFDFGTLDFTIEFWVYLLGSTYETLMARRPGAAGKAPFHISTGANSELWVLGSTDGTNWSLNILDPVPLSTSQWYHVVVTRSGDTFRLFKNGTNVASSGAITGALMSTSEAVTIGNDKQVGVNDFYGYIDDIRITKGVARYTVDFTPPTRQNADQGQPVDPYWNNVVLGLHMDGLDGRTVFHDEKGKTVTAVGNVKTVTSNKKFGNSSAYFDGAGDFLSAPHSTDFILGASDFCIECFVYPTSNSNNVYHAVFSKKQSITQGGWVGLYVRNDVVVLVVDTVIGGSWESITYGTLSVPINQWTHLAVVRYGSEINVYVGGSEDPTALYATALDISNTTTADFRIGVSDAAGSEPFMGYIDDLRVTKGIARYTSNFTPPTRAFPRN